MFNSVRPAQSEKTGRDKTELWLCVSQKRDGLGELLRIQGDRKMQLAGCRTRTQQGRGAQQRATRSRSNNDRAAEPTPVVVEPRVQALAE